MKTTVEVVDGVWEKGRDALYSYITGFVLSLLCTLMPYFAVTRTLLSKPALVTFVLFFAVTQFLIQVIFFLHLPARRKPYWNLIVFFFTLAIVTFLFVGTLWIMYHLNQNMMGIMPTTSNEGFIPQ